MKIFKALEIPSKYFFLLIYMYYTRIFHFYTYYFKRERYFKAISNSARFYFPILGLKLSIHNQELIPPPSSCFLIVANHQSTLDIPILSATIPCAFIQRPVSFIPGISWHFGKLSLVIKRDNPISLIKSIKFVKELAASYHTPVALFPEGTRAKNRELGELHLGAAAIAKTAKLPILPITICNSSDFLPRGAIAVKPGTIYVVIHSPIAAEFIEGHSHAETTLLIKEKLQAGLDYYNNLPK